jgi:nucleoside-diphosphate-sugar epimerase
VKDKLILIAGGAGYVGGELIKKSLEKGMHVICLDILLYGDSVVKNFSNIKNFKLIKGDIRNWNLIKEATKNVDYVVNLAAIVGDKPCEAAPISAYQINFKGNLMLAEASKLNNVSKYIFASTCSNYGISDPNKFATEDSFLNPVSLYAETKIDSENTLKSLSSNSFSTTSLRFGTAYGMSKRTRFDLTVNSFAYEALFNKKIVVFAKETWRPYVHVKDMTTLIFGVLNSKKKIISGQILNAGFTDQNFRKVDIALILKNLMPNLEVSFITSVDDRRDYRVSFNKIEKLLNIKNNFGVKEGFEEIILAFNNGHLTEKDFNSNSLNTITKFFQDKEKNLSLDEIKKN